MHVTADLFFQTDPVPGGSANAYDYANQDPVGGLELDGKQPICAGGDGFGMDGFTVRQPCYGWIISNPHSYNGMETEARMMLAGAASLPAKCLIGGSMIAGKKAATETPTQYRGGELVGKLLGKLFAWYALYNVAQCFVSANSGG